MSARLFGSGTAAGETSARGEAPSLLDSGKAPRASAAAAGPTRRSGTRAAGRLDDRLEVGFLNRLAAVNGNAAVYCADLPSLSLAINRELAARQSAQLAAALRAPPPLKKSARRSFWSIDRSSAASNEGAASNLIGPAAADVLIASTPMTAMTHLWNTCTSNDSTKQIAFRLQLSRPCENESCSSPNNSGSPLRLRRCQAVLTRCRSPSGTSC